MSITRLNVSFVRPTIDGMIVQLAMGDPANAIEGIVVGENVICHATDGQWEIALLCGNYPWCSTFESSFRVCFDCGSSLPTSAQQSDFPLPIGSVRSTSFTSTNSSMAFADRPLFYCSSVVRTASATALSWERNTFSSRASINLTSGTAVK